MRGDGRREDPKELDEEGLCFHVEDVFGRQVEGGGQFCDGHFEAAIEGELDGRVFFAGELGWCGSDFAENRRQTGIVVRSLN